VQKVNNKMNKYVQNYTELSKSNFNILTMQPVQTVRNFPQINQICEKCLLANKVVCISSDAKISQFQHSANSGILTASSIS